MAQNSQSAEIEALIRRSRAARQELKTAYAAFRHKLDVPARVKDSLRAHPLGWFGGSLATGLLASFFVSKGHSHKNTETAAEPKKKRAGLGGFALTAAASMAKPLVKAWLAKKLRGPSAGFQPTLFRRRFGSPGA
jgi:hypothetical protein